MFREIYVSQDNVIKYRFILIIQTSHFTVHILGAYFWGQSKYAFVRVNATPWEGSRGMIWRGLYERAEVLQVNKLQALELHVSNL